MGRIPAEDVRAQGHRGFIDCYFSTVISGDGCESPVRYARNKIGATAGPCVWIFEGFQWERVVLGALGRGRVIGVFRS